MKYDKYQEKENGDTITLIIAVDNLKNEANYLKTAKLERESRWDACLVLFVFLFRSLRLRSYSEAEYCSPTAREGNGRRLNDGVGVWTNETLHSQSVCS